MAGPEIFLGIAGLLAPLIAAPVESAIRTRFHKPHYEYHCDREEVCSHFEESWMSLESNISQLRSIIPTLAHNDQHRRLVLKELERATKLFQETNARILACKPIRNALQEQEKTDMFLEAIGKKIGATGMVPDEKMAAILGSIIDTKLPSSSTGSSNRENGMQIPVDRNSRSMDLGNPNSCDESFFDHSQFSRDGSSRDGKRGKKHARNARAHRDRDNSLTHHHRKCRHNSPSPSSSPSFCGGCSGSTLCDSPPRREERYLDHDRW